MEISHKRVELIKSLINKDESELYTLIGYELKNKKNPLSDMKFYCIDLLLDGLVAAIKPYPMGDCIIRNYSDTPIITDKHTIKGIKWFQKNKEKLQHEICTNKYIIKYILNGGEEIEIISCIADCIFRAISILNEIIAVSSAIIIIKNGIKLFCKKFANTSTNEIGVKGYYRKDGKYVKGYIRKKKIKQ